MRGPGVQSEHGARGPPGVQSQHGQIDSTLLDSNGPLLSSLGLLLLLQSGSFSPSSSKPSSSSRPPAHPPPPSLEGPPLPALAPTHRQDNGPEADLEAETQEMGWVHVEHPEVQLDAPGREGSQTQTSLL